MLVVICFIFTFSAKKVVIVVTRMCWNDSFLIPRIDMGCLLPWFDVWKMHVFNFHNVLLVCVIPELLLQYVLQTIQAEGEASKSSLSPTTHYHPLHPPL